jgi:hypothetical protein
VLQRCFLSWEGGLLQLISQSWQCVMQEVYDDGDSKVLLRLANIFEVHKNILQHSSITWKLSSESWCSGSVFPGFYGVGHPFVASLICTMKQRVPTNSTKIWVGFISCNHALCGFDRWKKVRSCLRVPQLIYRPFSQTERWVGFWTVSCILFRFTSLHAHQKVSCLEE